MRAVIAPCRPLTKGSHHGARPAAVAYGRDPCTDSGGSIVNGGSKFLFVAASEECRQRLRISCQKQMDVAVNQSRRQVFATSVQQYVRILWQGRRNVGNDTIPHADVI